MDLFILGTVCRIKGSKWWSTVRVPYAWTISAPMATVRAGQRLIEHDNYLVRRIELFIYLCIFNCFSLSFLFLFSFLFLAQLPPSEVCL